MKERSISNNTLVIVGAAVVGALIATICFVFAPMIAHNGAAADVDGTIIKESDVTAYIDSVRAAQSLTDDDDWSDYLESSGTTASAMRQSAIQTLAGQVCVEHVAQQLGVNVSDEDVDSDINTTKTNLGGDDAFAKYLKSYGMTEDSYRAEVRESLLEDALSSKISSMSDDSDDAVIDYINTNYSSSDSVFWNAYAISLDISDSTDAAYNEALKNGTKSFEDIAKERNGSLSSVSLGWVSNNTLSSEAISALNSVDKNQASSPISTSDTIVTYYVWSDTYILSSPFKSFDGVPDSLKEQLKSEATTSTSSNLYSKYMADAYAHMTITIYAMPNGLSYDIK